MVTVPVSYAPTATGGRNSAFLAQSLRDAPPGDPDEGDAGVLYVDLRRSWPRWVAPASVMRPVGRVV